MQWTLRGQHGAGGMGTPSAAPGTPLGHGPERRGWMSVKNETMIKMKKQMAEKILNHALGIIYLLTGEEYVIVKKNSPHSTMHLLTGEIPVKCGDISIYFSMEEWDYIEEHRDHYKSMVLEEGISVSDRCSGPYKNSFNIVFLGEEKLSEKNTEEANFKKSRAEESRNQSLAEDSHTGSQDGTVEDDTSVSRGYHGGNSSIASSTCDTESHTTSCPQWQCETWTVNNNIISKDLSKKKTPSRKKKTKNSVTGAPKDVTLNGTKIPRTAHLGEHCGRCCVDRSHFKRRHTGEKSFSCNVCGKHFAHKPLLLAHQRSHTGETCYWCGECGMFYTYKSQLTAHQRTHRADRFYPCHVCGQKFDFRCLLLVHQQIHTGPKPHRCLECGERFTYRSGLVVHQRTHTGEKPHRCKYCGEHFSDGHSLTTHQKVHTAEKTHKCPDCGKTFDYKASLIVHQRAHKLDGQQKALVKPNVARQKKGQIFSSAMDST